MVDAMMGPLVAMATNGKCAMCRNTEADHGIAVMGHVVCSAVFRIVCK